MGRARPCTGKMLTIPSVTVPGEGQPQGSPTRSSEINAGEEIVAKHADETDHFTAPSTKLRTPGPEDLTCLLESTTIAEHAGLNEGSATSMTLVLSEQTLRQLPLWTITAAMRCQKDEIQKVPT